MLVSLIVTIQPSTFVGRSVCSRSVVFHPKLKIFLETPASTIRPSSFTPIYVCYHQVCQEFDGGLSLLVRLERLGQVLESSGQRTT